MYIPSFMRLASIVFKLSKDPDFSRQTDGRTDGRTDWQTDGRTEGKPIVPSGVNTGRGLKILQFMLIKSTDIFMLQVCLQNFTQFFYIGFLHWHISISMQPDTHLWKTSCSVLRSILGARSGLTFSRSFSSSCCAVSMQYSAVHRMEQMRHCSSSVNFVTSPSFRMLWMRPDADDTLLPWPDSLQMVKFMY